MLLMSEKSDRKRNIPYGFTYLWNLRTNPPKKTNKNKHRLIETWTKEMVDRGERGREWVKKGYGKYSK